MKLSESNTFKIISSLKCKNHGAYQRPGLRFPRAPTYGINHLQVSSFHNIVGLDTSPKNWNPKILNMKKNTCLCCVKTKNSIVKLELMFFSVQQM